MDGIYHIHFSVHGNAGEGLVVLNDGKAHGGDASYLYAGAYEGSPDNFTAKIEVNHWNGPRNNIFGDIDQISLELTGKKVSSGKIVGEGHPVGSPQQMTFELRKLRELT